MKILFIKLSVHFQGTNIIWISQIKVILVFQLFYCQKDLPVYKKNVRKKQEEEKEANLMNLKWNRNKINNSQLALIDHNKTLDYIKQIFFVYTLPVVHKASGIKIACRISSSAFILYFGWQPFHQIEGICSHSSLSP